MAGFWAGFGAQFSKEVNEIRDELREDSRTRRNYILNNGGRIVANARAKADEVLEMVNEAMAKGVSEKALLGMYQQSGASGIKKFHAALLKRPNLNAEDFKSISDIGQEWAKDTNLSLTDTILRGMNVYHDPEAGPEERKQNIFQGIITGGAGQDAFMGDKMYGGYTGYDIKRMEAGVAQSPTEGNIDVLALVGPAPKSPTIQNQNVQNVRQKFKENLPRLIKIKLGRKAQIAALRADGTNTAETDAEEVKLTDEINSLTNMKNAGFQVTDMITYAKNYDPSIYQYITKIEAADAGSYSRNSALTEMWSNYRSYEQDLKNDNLHFVTNEAGTGKEKALRHADQEKQRTGRAYQAFVLIDNRVVLISSESSR